MPSYTDGAATKMNKGFQWSASAANAHTMLVSLFPYEVAATGLAADANKITISAEAVEFESNSIFEMPAEPADGVDPEQDNAMFGLLASTSALAAAVSLTLI